jgi:transcriptional regulator
LYLPAHFVETDARWTREFIEQIGAGVVTTRGATQWHANLVPLLFDEKRNLLRGHIARANPQWSDCAGEAHALVTFTGANAYISPNWYPSKAESHRVVPTWNYEMVQLFGTISYNHDAATLIDIVSALTDREEAKSETPWRLSDAPPDYIDAMVKSIVGFEIVVERIEAKRKLSQNHTEANRWGVIAGLRERGDMSSNAIADAMETLNP